MNIWDNIVRFFQGGGEFMFPIALVFVVGLAIALERYVYLVHAAVATVNPAGKANLLSASISVAMNCTAFGLMTAVPLLFIHAWLQTRTTELIDSLEMASVKFLNAITERQSAAAPA